VIERFYLGTHRPHWLALTVTSLFVSHQTLAPGGRARKRLPQALGSWALDSGAFTELRDHGRWTLPVGAYVDAVRRYRDEVGGLDWAAPQDWMCEPIVIAGGEVRGQRFVGTHLSVREHQFRTVANFLELRSLAPDLPFIPVLQGWTLADYHRCVELYDMAGVDLRAEPLVGLGSVCRRQATEEIREITGSLSGLDLRLHGFGVKAAGLQRYAEYLASADSMAWSSNAREEGRRRGHPAPGCNHRSCANCLPYALRWRERVTRRLERVQLSLRLVA
jgi:hypothetical protein